MVKLPPRYVNVPVELVYSDLSRQVITTGVRIWGLGWRHNYERTDPISLEELCEITDLSRSQLYGHLGALSGAGVLRYTSTGGEFCFRFDRDPADDAGDPPGEARAGPSPENRTDETIDVVDDSLSSFIRERYVSHHETTQKGQQQQSCHAVVVGEECEEGGGLSGNLDQDPGPESEILDGMGVAEPTRSRLVELEHVTEAYLEAWRSWFDSQSELGIGWVITQIRAEAQPPEGAHEGRRRDSEGRYAKWIQT